MKRWGSQTLSYLCLLALASGATAATALAGKSDLVAAQKDELKTKATLLAQSNIVLELGSTGAAVKDLQAMLTLMGYYSGAVDGNYANLTMEAVRRFQAVAGLEVDGVVGPLTWQRLLPTPATLAASQEPDSDEPTVQADSAETAPARTTVSVKPENLPVLELDDFGDDVRRLQRQLAAQEFYTGAVDGLFGLQTQRAVEEFQSQSGLLVDGIVGPATWLKLME